jgi:hypothetical protein
MKAAQARRLSQALAMAGRAFSFKRHLSKMLIEVCEELNLSQKKAF